MNRLVIILGGALFLSLAGNLFMAGYMFGGHAGHKADVAVPEKQDDRAEWKKRDDELRKKLSDADRKVFEEIKSANQDKIQDLKKALDEARFRVEDAQHADPIDKQALEDAIRGEAAARAEFLGTIRTMRKDIASKISPEGRSAMEKLRPPKPAHDSKRNDRRRGEFMERWRERGGPDRDRPPHENEDMPMKSGDKPEFAPEMTPEQDGYGKPSAPPPPTDDCGGCEVPGAPPETPPQP